MTAVATPTSKKTGSGTTKSQNLRDIIADALAANVEFTEATAKLEQLHEERNKIHGQLSKLPEKNTGQLASAILAGEDLDAQELNEVKRAALIKRMAAYDDAITKQQAIVTEKRVFACEDVEAAMKPIHFARRQNVHEAIVALEKANSEFEEVQVALSQYRIRHNLAFNGLMQIRSLTTQLEHVVKNS